MSVLINFARFYATTKHAGQLYAGSLPYTHHLAAVEGQVRKWWHSIDWDTYEGTVMGQRGTYYELLEHVVAAAWLHDVREDCGVKDKEIRELFGPFIADLVGALTNEQGATRRVRHARTYPKIREMRLALFLKLCDRLANIEQGGTLLQMYQKEQEDFERTLRTRGLFDPMWEHMNTLLAQEVQS